LPNRSNSTQQDTIQTLRARFPTVRTKSKKTQVCPDLEHTIQNL
jgi:hypothetical protein